MQLKRQSLLLISMLAALIGYEATIAATVGFNPLRNPATQGAGASTQPPASTPGGGGPSALPANAGAVLQAIKLNTDMILQKINNLPHLLMELKDNLLRTQESGKKPDALLFSIQQYLDSTGQLFQYGITRNPSFSDSNNDSIDSFNNYLLRLQKEGFANSQSIEGKTFGSNSFALDRTIGQAPIEQVIPKINALAYTTAIGLPPLTANAKPDPTWTDTYIKAASGANIYHSTLAMLSEKVTIPQKQYQSYFDLAYAVQSFNNYILGKYILNNDKLSQNQSVLYRKASGSDYLSTIATEPLGYLFRDMLLFQSQQYVLTTKLVEIQRETLMAQIMTNALLISANRSAESALFDKTLAR